MIKDDRLYILHIIESINVILSYIEGYTLERFTDDRKTYDATLRNLQIMTESTQRLSKEIKEKYPHIHWHSIAGFRNILVHEYLGTIDNHIVWNVITSYLPTLRDILLQELPST